MRAVPPLRGSISAASQSGSKCPSRTANPGGVANPGAVHPVLDEEQANDVPVASDEARPTDCVRSLAGAL